MQKEFKELKKAIHKWVKTNRSDVSFVGSFVSFGLNKRNKNYAVKDNMVVGYGNKEEVEIQLKELNKFLGKEKKGFVNW